MDKKKPTTKGKLGNESRINNTSPNLASLYLFTLSPTGADLALLICLEEALWIS
jgi:hypothetical protein